LNQRIRDPDLNGIKEPSPLRILIVEDNPDVAENIGDYLEAEKRTPVLILTARDALADKL
jgi:DNA-binding response OmpR family regulator